MFMKILFSLIIFNNDIHITTFTTNYTIVMSAQYLNFNEKKQISSLVNKNKIKKSNLNEKITNMIKTNKTHSIFIFFFPLKFDFFSNLFS